MNKRDLAKIIEESIKDKVKLMDCEGVPDELQPFSNICYKPDPEKDSSQWDPTIPVFIETDKGLRKAFSITITE